MSKLEIIGIASFLVTGMLAAQTRSQTAGSHASSVSAYKLTQIKVTGTKRYTPEQIVAFSGLRPGENVSEENFKDIVQRLGETGMFTNVAYSFSFSPAGTKVEFQLADNDKLVPVEFDNFVWFSDQALIEKMQKYVPLFRGEMPISGNLPDKVTDALQFVLAGRGLEKARVEVNRHGDEEAGTIDRVIYSISGVEIHIRNMEFPGAGTAELPLLTRAAQRAQGGDYERSKLRMFARLDLTPVYLRKGKLRAKFGEPQAR